MGALIRKLVDGRRRRARSRSSSCFVGGLSSVATDAGYLILIPLGRGRVPTASGGNPLAGLAAAYAGVSAGFARQHPDHAARRPAHRGDQRGDPSRRPEPIDRPHRQPLFSDRVDDLRRHRHHGRSPSGSSSPALGTFDRWRRRHGDGRRRASPEGEARGLRFASSSRWPPSSVLALLTVLPRRAAAQPRDRAIFNDSPFMESLIFIITMMFLVGRHRLRDRCRDDPRQRRRHQRRSPRRSPACPG